MPGNAGQGADGFRAAWRATVDVGLSTLNGARVVVAPGIAAARALGLRQGAIDFVHADGPGALGQ